MPKFAGIDVGAPKKGFHGCVLEGSSIVAGPECFGSSSEVSEWLQPHSPKVIAVDSPRSPAPPGATRRDSEAEFIAAKICGIRWTPEKAKLANPYYEWIVSGLELYEVMGRLSGTLIEVFPTASWTRWLGPRGSTSRARWSREGLERLQLDGLPGRRLNQDDRDAVAAARTAQQFSQGKCQAFGDIVVPKSSTALRA